MAMAICVGRFFFQDFAWRVSTTVVILWHSEGGGVGSPSANSLKVRESGKKIPFTFAILVKRHHEGLRVIHSSACVFTGKWISSSKDAPRSNLWRSASKAGQRSHRWSYDSFSLQDRRHVVLFDMLVTFFK